jgi:PEP-CTERM motif
MTTLRNIALASTAFVLASICTASATTITFEGAVNDSGEMVPVTPYTEGGFTLTNLQGGYSDGIFGSTSGGNTNGTATFGWCSICNNGSSNVIELTAAGGTAFSLASLDAAFLEGGSGPQSIVAVGDLVGGGTITETLVLSAAWTTFNLSGFNSVLSVDFSAGSASFPDPAFDNLVVTTAVPEPSTWAMMILGFAGIGYMAYRRRNSALHVA